MVTSPDGQSYVGQTKMSLKDRWDSHISCAFGNADGGCRLLNESIRDYGPENFEVDVLMSVPDKELLVREQECIKMYGTLYPLGLNFPPGDHAKNHCKLNDPVLPKYINVIRGNDMRIDGYLVVGHPSQEGAEMRFEGLTPRDQLKSAVSYLKELYGERVVCERECLAKFDDGYCVDYPGKPMRFFVTTELSEEENLWNACEYLDYCETTDPITDESLYIVPRTHGYYVKYGAYKDRRFFVDRHRSMDEKYEQAVRYLNELKHKKESAEDRYITKIPSGYRVDYGGRTYYYTCYTSKYNTMKERYSQAVAFLNTMLESGAAPTSVSSVESSNFVSRGSPAT